MSEAIELYVHIPFCMRKCLYCDFLSGPYDRVDRERYTKALLQEIRYYGDVLNHPRVRSLFVGGGTPTWLEPEWMEEILCAIRSTFDLEEDCEVTMECNPGTVTEDSLGVYLRAGVNRLSIGLQSCDDEELRLLGRIHDVNRFYKTYELARRAGFSNINIDLMTGIPHQTLDSLKKTLKIVTGLRPEHLSVYDLIVEDNTPFHDMYIFDVVKRQAGQPTEVLPDEDTELAMTLMVEDFLEKKGYHQYEISNFARDGRECRHNVGYWTRVPYLGLGAGSASLLHETRWSNESDLYRYMEACEKLPNLPASESLMQGVSKLSRYEQMEEFMFLGLRMNEGISLEEFEHKFGASCTGIYGKTIRDYRNQELIEMSRGRLFLTPRGRQVGNLVFEGFLIDRN